MLQEMAAAPINWADPRDLEAAAERDLNQATGESHKTGSSEWSAELEEATPHQQIEHQPHMKVEMFMDVLREDREGEFSVDWFIFDTPQNTQSTTVTPRAI